MISHNQDLIDRAIAAEMRHCERNGLVFTHPASDSWVDGDTVKLVNVNGPVADYRWTGKRLTRLS